MKTVIRRGVFETNSSSTHSLTIVKGSESAPKDMEVSFEVISPTAKVFMIFGFVENAGCECSGAKGWPRDIVMIIIGITSFLSGDDEGEVSHGGII